MPWESGTMPVMARVDAVSTEDSDVVVRGARVVWRGFLAPTNTQCNTVKKN